MDGGPKDHHVTLSHKRPRATSLTPPQKYKGICTSQVLMAVLCMPRN